MIKQFISDYISARQIIKEMGLSKKELFEVMREYKILISGGLTNE